MSRTPLAVALAGLLTFSSIPFLAGPTADALATPAFVTYLGPGAIGPLEERFGDGTLPVGQPIGSEPSLGINPHTGALLYIVGEETYRVAFDDAAGTATWTDVSPLTQKFSLDPILWTDPATGRTFTAALSGNCSVASFTDDDGATWTQMTNSCTLTLDHPSLVSGPWRHGVKPVQATSDRVVYYCGQQGFVTCMQSLDGGLTFAPTPARRTTSNPTSDLPSAGIVRCGLINPGLHGSLHIDAQGRVYLPFKSCGTVGNLGAGAAYTHNNGLDWGFAKVPNATEPADGFDPDVGSGPTKTYLGFQNATGLPMVSISTNGGLSWGNPIDVGSAAGIRTSTMPEMVVGDDDRAALVYYGTKDTGNAFAPDFTGVWHLYASMTYDGGLTWEVLQITPDPVQRGNICADGVGCTARRNLLDFMDAQLDTRGRLWIAYTDGCVGVCATTAGTPAQSESAIAGIARQVGGRPLLAAFDPLVDADTTGPYTGAAGTAVAVGATAAGGTGPYTYAWTLVDRPSGSAATAADFADATAAATTFTPDVGGHYRLRVEITDSLGAKDSDTTVLTATAGATPPPPVPLLADASGDALLPGTDITGAYVFDETLTSFKVQLNVTGLGTLPSTANTKVGNAGPFPSGIEQQFVVSFVHTETAGNPILYQVTAAKYAVATPGDEFAFSLNTRQAPGTGTAVTGLTDIPGIWDEVGDRIVWTVPRAAMTVKIPPPLTGPGGDIVNGTSPKLGDKLTSFTASAQVWAWALGSGGSLLNADSASGSSSFTFAHGDARGMAASAGGPYQGNVGAAIAVTANPTGGTAPYTYAWNIQSKPAASSATAANFADATAASTTFTPDVAGNFVLSVTITDATSATATGNATLTAKTTGGGGGVVLASGTIFAGTPHTTFVSGTRAPVVTLTGVDSFSFAAPPAGTTITTVTTDNSGEGYDLDIYFFSTNSIPGRSLPSGSCATEAIDEICVVPAGTVRVEIAAFFGLLLDVDVVTV